MRTILFVALATVLSASVSLAQEPAKVGDSAKGKTLVDAKGMTLYIYDRDTAAGGLFSRSFPSHRCDAKVSDAAGGRRYS
jgi:predicted lipoprotein with Yx(FWY)xxD motif